MEGFVARAEVAREKQPKRRMLVFSSLDFDLQGCRAQDMAGVPEAHPDARRGLQPLLVDHIAHLRKAGLGVFQRIDRLQLFLSALLVAPVQPLNFGFLDAAGVRQHESEQIAGAGRRVDGSAEPGLGQPRQHAAMVDMGMGQQHEGQFAGIEGQGPVVERVECFRSLEHAAIHQEAALGMDDAVAGTGDAAGRAVEIHGDCHSSLPSIEPPTRALHGEVSHSRLRIQVLAGVTKRNAPAFRPGRCIIECDFA